MTDDTISGPDRAPEPDRTDSSGPMDGLDDQAALSPGQVLMQIYAFFYKKAVGLVLLLLAGTLSLLGVLFPQMPSSVRGDPEAAARWVESARSVFGGWTDVLRTAGVFTMFSSVPFLVVMALLALSIIACTVHRLPVIWNAARHPRTRVTARFFDRARLRSRFTAPVSAEKAFQVIRADARGHRMRFIVDDGGPGRNAYIDRNRWGPFGTAFAHTAFVIIMAGFVVSSVTGFSDQEFTLTIGHPKDVGHGTALVAEARSFQDTYYEDGSPKDYVADLAIYDGGEEVANREVRINSPLSYDGVVFHQAYFGVAAVLTITDDSGAEAAGAGAVDIRRRRPIAFPTWLTVPLHHRYMAAVSILTVVATGVLTAPYLPLWKATDQNFNTPNAETKKEDPEARRVSTAREVITTIPEGSTVVTDLSMLAYLVPRAEVSWMGTSGPDKEYVVMNRNGGGNQWSTTDAATWGEQHSKQGATYTVIYNKNGFQIAKRNG